MRNPVASHRSLLWLLAAAGTLYACVAILGPGVGHINDDAHYLLGAKALLGGSYLSTVDPQSPRPFPYPPGASLLLTPFVALLEPRWDWLQAVSIAWTLAAGALLYALAESGLAPGLGLWAAGLWLLHPTTVRLASPVMSEPPVAALIPASLLWLRGLLAGGGGRTPPAFGLGLLLGLATLVRYSAFPLTAAALVGLAAGGRARLIGAVAAGAALPPAAYAAWLHGQTGAWTAYDSAWRASASFLAEPARLGEHLVRFLHTTFTYGLLGIELPYSAASVVLSLALTAALLAPLSRLPSLWRASGGVERGLLAAAAAATALWLAVHALWPFIGARFSYPVFGVFLALWLASLRPWAPPARAVAAASVLAGGVFATRIVQDVRLTQASFRPPARAQAWAAANLPQDARLLAVMAAEWRLLTGRAAIASVPAPDEAGFRRALQAAKITHVVRQPLILKQAAYAARAPGPPEAWLEDFPVAYADPDGTTIYAAP
ncbi:MAG: hypothetical protein HY553_01730 [Elusimicrobia bacterium]|nr:hypothetical protein [Elusimicrobiota bacterium]